MELQNVEWLFWNKDTKLSVGSKFCNGVIKEVDDLSSSDDSFSASSKPSKNNLATPCVKGANLKTYSMTRSNNVSHFYVINRMIRMK